MRNFSKFAEPYLQGQGNFNALPVMVQDCIRSMGQLSTYKEFNKIVHPVMLMTYGSYSYETIKEGVEFFWTHDIHSFVFSEGSTATLGLLEMIMSVDKAMNLKLSCSCSERYFSVLTDRWNNPVELHGLLIKITEKKSESRAKTLRGDLIF